MRSALRNSYEGLREAVAEETGNGTDGLGLGDEAAEAVTGAIVALFDGLLIQWLLEPDRFLLGLSSTLFLNTFAPHRVLAHVRWLGGCHELLEDREE